MRHAGRSRADVSLAGGGVDFRPRHSDKRSYLLSAGEAAAAGALESVEEESVDDDFL